MAILRWDSFAYAPDGTVTSTGDPFIGNRKWASQGGDVWVVDHGNGRKGIAVKTAGQNLEQALDAQEATVFLHFTLECESASHVTKRLVKFWDNGFETDLLGTIAIRDGLIEYNVDSAGTAGQSVVARSTTPMPLLAGGGTFQHIVVKVTFSQTVGVVQIWVNGTSEVSVSTQDTIASASATDCGHIALGAGDAFDAVYNIGDWIVDDAANLGVRHVGMITTNASGNSADWTPLASTNESQVDDEQPDEDSTYNSSGTSTDRDELNLTTLPDMDSVDAVCPLVRARKTTGDASLLDTGIRENVTTGMASSDHALTTTYQWWSDLFLLNPDTSSLFTPTEVGASQIAYENTSV